MEFFHLHIELLFFYSNWLAPLQAAYRGAFIHGAHTHTALLLPTRPQRASTHARTARPSHTRRAPLRARRGQLQQIAMVTPATLATTRTQPHTGVQPRLDHTRTQRTHDLAYS